jgi:hypothetical protein
MLDRGDKLITAAVWSFQFLLLSVLNGLRSTEDMRNRNHDARLFRSIVSVRSQAANLPQPDNRPGH